jgi:hypothetical protein
MALLEYYREENEMIGDIVRVTVERKMLWRIISSL